MYHEAFLYWVYKNLPWFVYLGMNLVLMVVSYAAGNGQAHWVWRSNIKYHLPEVYKEELQRKDREIRELKKELRETKEQLQKFKEIIEALKAVLKELKIW